MTILILCALVICAVLWSGKIQWPKMSHAYICWSDDRRSAFVFFVGGTTVFGNLYRDNKCVQFWAGTIFEAPRWCAEQGLQKSFYEIEDVTHPDHVVYKKAKA